MRITPHRVINAVAFASMSSTILTNVLFPPSFGTVGNAYGQVFIDGESIAFPIPESNLYLYFRAYEVVLGAIPNSLVLSSVWLLKCTHSLVGNGDGNHLLYSDVCVMHSAYNRHNYLTIF